MKLALALLLVMLGCPGPGGGGPVTPKDEDGDGSAAGQDCDDRSADVRPSALEDCDDTRDNDCDKDVDGEDGDCAAATRELTVLGTGRTRYAVHHGPGHDILLEVALEPAPPSGSQMLTAPVTIDRIATPGTRLGGGQSAIHVVAVLHAKQLIPDGPYRRDLVPGGKWLLFGRGDDWFLMWTRIERSDPIQVVEVRSRQPLPDGPLRVTLPVRQLRIGQVVEIDLGGGVVRAVQVMAEPLSARGW